MANWYSRSGENFDASALNAGVYTSTVWNSASDGSGSWLSWTDSQTITDGYTVGDNFYCLGSVVLNIDITKQCNFICNNGYFSVTTSRTFEANFTGAAGKCLYIDADCTVAITGNVVGGTSNSMFGAQIAANRTVNLTINGCVTGGSGTNAAGIYDGGTGSTITINNGTNDAVTASGSRPGVNIMGTSSTVNITGNLIGGSTTAGSALFISGSGAQVNIIGNVMGGTVGCGINVNSGATGASLTVVGNVNGTAGIGIYSIAANVIIDITGNITSTGNNGAITLGNVTVLTQRNGNIMASGAAASSLGHGISVTTSGCILNLTGNVYGGRGAGANNLYGVKVNYSGTLAFALVLNGDVYAGIGALCHGISVYATAFIAYSVNINGNIFNNDKALGVAAPYTAPNSHLNFLQNPMAGGLTAKFSKLPSASPFRRINKRYV